MASLLATPSSAAALFTGKSTASSSCKARKTGQLTQRSCGLVRGGSGVVRPLTSSGPVVQLKHAGCVGSLPSNQDFRSARSASAQSARGEGAGSATSEVEVLASYDSGSSDVEGVCIPGEVVAYNEGDCTVVEITCKSFPGLFRVIAWCLTGLELTVESAELATSPDGIATNRFTVVNRKGKPLPAVKAQLLAERVGEYVKFCTPEQDAMDATVFQSEHVTVCNGRDPDYTVVTILADRGENSMLLLLASVVTGIGLDIHKAIIQGRHSKPADDRRRRFRFWLTDDSGKKLDFGGVSSLMYVLDLVLNKNAQPLKPPMGPTAAKYATDTLDETADMCG